MTTTNPSQPVSPNQPGSDIGSSRVEERTVPSAIGAAQEAEGVPNWINNARLLWRKRRTLARTAGISMLVALAVALLLPKRYESSARIMPPASTGSGAALLAALASGSGGGFGSLGSLGSLAGGILGGAGNTSLFIDLLRSGSVSGDLIDRFDLQHVYKKRYRIDTAKFLARRTKIVDDKKSGVITVTVTDSDPVRARDIAQGYVDELNQLVNRTNTSSAHQERLFIERRLAGVEHDLETAQERLSNFSSTHATVDLKEQSRSMVDAAARLQGELIAEQSSLDSLRQTYGDGNIRVRSAQARIASLRAEIAKLGGTSMLLPADESSSDIENAASGNNDELYPALRQLPRLAVPYAKLYREVQVQETVYELLTRQYEVARIQEAKDVPVISVIDAPGIPEKKSFPPRTLIVLLAPFTSVIAAAFLLLLEFQWAQIPMNDPRKDLAHEIGDGMPQRLSWRHWTRSRQ
jgi:capsule polysaccharide export protein KpsE/RkpR